MTDHEVEQRLGYSPCVCAKIDGTWHPECYRGKTADQLAAGRKRAYAAARRHIKAQAALAASTAIQRAAAALSGDAGGGR